MADGEAGPSPVWDGSCDEEGLPHGDGKMTYPIDNADEEQDGGDVFEGRMEHGVKQGPGTYAWKGGSTYDGNYEAGLRSGHGRLMFYEGGQYDGNFAEGLFHGDGVYTYANGDFYKGSWKEGRRHGVGVYHCKVLAKSRSEAQCQYAGEWTDGEFASGRLLFRDGSTYSGSFVASRPEGQGEFCFAESGCAQKGAFEDGKWTQDAAPPLSA